MYGIFTYIYHKNQVNVAEYTIHGYYGDGKSPSSSTGKGWGHWMGLGKKYVGFCSLEAGQVIEQQKHLRNHGTPINQPVIYP